MKLNIRKTLGPEQMFVVPDGYPFVAAVVRGGESGGSLVAGIDPADEGGMVTLASAGLDETTFIAGIYPFRVWATTGTATAEIQFVGG